MKYFLDSAKIDEIDYAYKYYGIDGVTTNPRHVMASGKPFGEFIRLITEWIRDNHLEGADVFPVSVEIDPFIEEWGQMVEAAMKVAALSENFVIKIPCTEQGLIAARQLENQGIRTNVTLVFSPSQAIAAHRLGAKFVSPFVGWKEASGEETTGYIDEIIQIYDNYESETEVIVAALRNGRQIVEAALSGADIVTCGLSVFKESFEHPFTGYGLGVFREAWQNTAKD